MAAVLQHHEIPTGRPVVDDLRLTRLMNALMDRIECGMLACGPHGELVHANLTAQRELATSTVLRLENGSICCHGKSGDAWEGALHDATARHRSSLVALSDGTHRVMAAVSPAADDDEALAVVVIGRRSLCSTLGLEMLAASCGLTLAEQRVLRALIDNRTAREIADDHGVAVTTIRTQILSIREKLGVRSIEALLLRAAEVPPITARH